MSCESRLPAATPPVSAPVSAITVPAPAVVPVRIRTRTAAPDVPTVKLTAPDRNTPAMTGRLPSMPVIWQTIVSEAAAGEPTTVELDRTRGARFSPSDPVLIGYGIPPAYPFTRRAAGSPAVATEPGCPRC